MMKLLSNPDWLELVVDLTADECKEILFCLLDYPNRESKLSAWRFMKKELARSTQKYKEEAERMKNNQQKRWESSQTDKTSYKTGDDVLQTVPPSDVLKVDRPIDNNNQKNKKTIDSILNSVARNMDINAPKRYEIVDGFDFKRLATTDSTIAELYNQYDSTTLQKAQNTLWQKRYGERLNIRQLITWIEQEGKY